MKLRPLSDLHLEFGPMPDLEPAGEDVLVLAGDIHIHVEGMQWAERQAARLGVPVLYLAGNHEFYRVGSRQAHTLSSTLDDLRAMQLAEGGVRFLENNAVLVADTLVLGATLWTDYALDGNIELGKLNAVDGMADYELIRDADGARITADILEAPHKESRRFLEGMLSIGGLLGNVVVVTHHLPSRRSIGPRFEREPTNPAFASDLDQLILDANPKLKLWVHGHTHDSFDYRIGETRIVCNPRGYWPGALNPNFNPNLVVEI